MRVLVLFLCLFGSTLAVNEEYGIGQRKFKVPNKLFLERQRDILHLFQHNFEPDYDEEHMKIANGYSIEKNIDAYINSSAVKQFVSLYKQGLLGEEDIFSIFDPAHLQQAISLFRLFYYARDYDTLYQTAVWARNYVNGGLFVYALQTALAHREDTFTFILPPIYEINPFYFIDGDRIAWAQKYKLQHVNTSRVVTSEQYRTNKEQSLWYYLEDVGLNAFYYYCNVYYPFWMDGEEFKLKNDRRGEQYYYLYQQLLARYYLERLSNDLGEIEYFNYEEPFKNGYYSTMRYPNGLPFPNRPNYARLTETYHNYGQSWSFKSRNGLAYSKVQDFERRLKDTIDYQYVFTKGALIDLLSSDQTNLLGNLVESNPDCVLPRYFGPLQIYARRLLGYSYQSTDSYKDIPSALEHFETASRDPAFYQLYKRIDLLFQQYKSYLPPYTYTELYYPGVKIEKVDFHRLYTYFDSFSLDITNAIFRSPGQDDSFGVKIVQQRLNHKPFTYKISVSSDREEEAIVRVYLGPKYDEYGRRIDINENRLNFVELDTFIHKLQPGLNVIERNSRQLYWFVPDRTTYRDLHKKVVESVGNTEQFQLDSSEAFYGFPNRLLLPKGKPEGQAFQIYVIINKYQAPARPEVQQDYYFHRVGTGMNYFDNYAFGFPFDRTIISSGFRVPNSKFQEVVIYHKNLDDSNSSQAQSG